MFPFLFTFIWYDLNYITICLCKDPNVISRSNRLVVYSLPTPMICIIRNHRLLNGLVLPVEREH